MNLNTWSQISKASGTNGKCSKWVLFLCLGQGCCKLYLGYSCQFAYDSFKQHQLTSWLILPELHRQLDWSVAMLILDHGKDPTIIKHCCLLCMSRPFMLPKNFLGKTLLPLLLLSLMDFLGVCFFQLLWLALRIPLTRCCGFTATSSQCKCHLWNHLQIFYLL